MEQKSLGCGSKTITVFTSKESFIEWGPFPFEISVGEWKSKTSIPSFRSRIKEG